MMVPLSFQFGLLQNRSIEVLLFGLPLYIMQVQLWVKIMGYWVVGTIGNILGEDIENFGEHNFYSYICLPPFGISDLG
jgi:hypothetical protein